MVIIKSFQWFQFLLKEKVPHLTVNTVKYSLSTSKNLIAKNSRPHITLPAGTLMRTHSGFMIIMSRTLHSLTHIEVRRIQCNKVVIIA